MPRQLLSFEPISFVCLSAILLSLAACEKASDTVRDYLEKGTNIGYKSCLESNKDKGLADGVVLSLCRKKHEQKIAVRFSANGGYQWRYGACSFGGWIQNKSQDVIITSFVILVKHDDNTAADGKPVIETLQINDLWVEPERGSAFTAHDLKFKPQEDRVKVEDHFLYSWSISEIRGIRVKLQ